MSLDLIAILDEQRRSEEPRDPSLPSVSDLYGCDRATWFRRNGYVFPEKDAATLRKFDVGHAVEARIAAHLEAVGTVELGLRVGLRIGEDGEIATRRLADDDELLPGEIGGHPDILLTRAFGWNPMRADYHYETTLIEVKTTDVRKPEAEAKPHYALQAAAYGIALADRILVHVTHVANFTKDEALHEVDLDGPSEVPGVTLRERVAQRMHEVLELTAPGETGPPPATPPVEIAEWACKYCDVGNCEKNAKKGSQALAVAFE